jgi:hypothetical protein
MTFMLVVSHAMFIALIPKKFGAIDLKDFDLLVLRVKLIRSLPKSLPIGSEG